MTYSIVARHPETGELGVGVQSHYMSVGSVVPWARPGVGAVATQANVNFAFGPDGLDLLASGATAVQAVERLISGDPQHEHRQLAIVDAGGGTAVFTGESTIPYAGHAIGKGVCCQANIAATEQVWRAMLAAFEAATTAGETLAQSLLAALDAGEVSGGDIRGRQSAALLVVPATGQAWEKTVELRVEDHPEPLAELRRLLGLHQGFKLADMADEAFAVGYPARAAELFAAASELVPASLELRFWHGLTLATTGDREQGLALIREAVAQHQGWGELLARLPETVFPGVGEVNAALKAQDSGTESGAGAQDSGAE
ncbi:MAG: DUF1028 domain-containing protein [Solirubrobacterales bacterium]|nr:DUF1028 domain-containing protein [Solirubrobacterales bacterium]